MPDTLGDLANDMTVPNISQTSLNTPLAQNTHKATATSSGNVQMQHLKKHPTFASLNQAPQASKATNTRDELYY